MFSEWLIKYEDISQIFLFFLNISDLNCSFRENFYIFSQMHLLNRKQLSLKMNPLFIMGPELLVIEQLFWNYELLVVFNNILVWFEELSNYIFLMGDLLTLLLHECIELMLIILIKKDVIFHLFLLIYMHH